MISYPYRNIFFFPHAHIKNNYTKYEHFPYEKRTTFLYDTKIYMSIYISLFFISILGYTNK